MGFLSGVSWLFCSGFLLLFIFSPLSLILSTLFNFCRIFSWFFLAIYYKLTRANDGLASFRAFKLANCHYKKVPENLTNGAPLCIIILSVWVGGSTAWGSTAQTTTHKGTHHTQPADVYFYPLLFRQMRNITKASVKAFKDAKNFKASNTEVFNGWTVQLYLFWNLIAQLKDGILLIKDAGRRTNTTKERLNGILDAFNLGGIYQKGKEADGKRARFFVDKFGNVEKWDSWKTFDLRA